MRKLRRQVLTLHALSSYSTRYTSKEFVSKDISFTIMFDFLLNLKTFHVPHSYLECSTTYFSKVSRSKLSGGRV